MNEPIESTSLVEPPSDPAPAWSRFLARSLAVVPVGVAGLVLAGYWIAMFIGTHLPPGEEVDSLELDKPIHFGAFVGLSCLLTIVLHKFGRPHWWAVPVLLAYALIDEVSQIPVGRTADPIDWICDATGTVFGLAFISWVLRQTPKPAGE